MLRYVDYRRADARAARYSVAAFDTPTPCLPLLADVTLVVI